MNDRVIMVFDFETGSRNPHRTQPTQIAAIALDPRKLTIKPNGTFNSEIRAIIDDDKAIAAGFDPLEEKALEITGKTRKGIDASPDVKLVWKQFCKFVNSFNWKKSQFFAPVPAGYNINGFDRPIISRLCKAFGPTNKEGQQAIFSKVFKIDIMDDMWLCAENDPDWPKVTMDVMRKKTGMGSENAHDALQDVRDTAQIIKASMVMKRDLAKKIDWKEFIKLGEL